MTAEDDEDLWNIYNLIRPEDTVECSTIRKVSDTNNKDKERSKSRQVKIKIAIVVETIDFDIGSQEIRLKGKNTTQNEFIKIGAYHSISIELDKSFKLEKDHWDNVDIELLKKSTDKNQKDSIGAVVLQEGVAHICLVTSSITKLLLKVESKVPKKHKGFADKYSEALRKLKVLILASPGFLKDQLLESIIENANKEKNSTIIQYKSRILTLKSSDGYLDSLQELIANENVQKQIADLKIVNEAKYLDQFGTMLANDEYSAVYGFKLTEFCIGKCAVKILMVLDKLYRSKDLEQRKKYFAICESARNENLAEVIVFSSLTESGKELERMGGIAAILKYPVHEIDEVEFEV